VSIFSKIGKGLKKLTLKKVLPFVAGAAALAIPGVGPVVAGAIGKATSVATKVIGGAATTVGTIAKSGAESAGSIAGLITAASGHVRNTLGEAREGIADLSEAADRAIHGPPSSALSFVQSPTGMMLILGAVVLLIVVLRK